MKQIVDGKQMKALDDKTIQHYGIPSLVLMERASLAVAEEIKNSFNTERILVVCGSGNNGADGIAVARILSLQGYQAAIFLAGKKESFTDEAKLQWNIAEKYGVPVVKNFAPAEYTTIVDAVFGVGLSREVKGTYRELFQMINQSGIPVVAVDIPSGIDAATGKIMGIAIRAVKTVTFGYGKCGLYFYPGQSYAGTVIVKDIGIYGKTEKALYALDDNERNCIPSRVPDGNKSTFGKVLVVAGSRNMCGAAYFASRSCMLAGSGMVRIFTEESNRVILQQKFPEAMLTTYGMHETKYQIRERLLQAMDWATAVVAGPGLGQMISSEWILESLLHDTTDKPMVLDADALNLLSRKEHLLDGCTHPLILTPHMGEMARLSGYSIEELKESPVHCLKEYWNRIRAMTLLPPAVIMKDARTLTCTDTDTCYLNLSGNSGMATAGSGDVLAGLLGGLIAQNICIQKAAPLAVWLHGLAGDEAKKQKGEHAVLASDIMEAIPVSMKRRLL